MKNKKEISRQKRHRAMLLKIKGAGSRPRLLVKRSLRNLSAQLIDDSEAKTLFSLATSCKEFKDKSPVAGNLKAAVIFGDIFAKKAKEKGITKIIFDRGGYLYHGRIKAFADALRKGGLEF